MTYNLILKNLIALLALLSVCGCVIAEMVGTKTEMILGLGSNLPENYQGVVIFENTPELKRIFKQNTKYITWGIRSDSINANSLPKELNLKYATININPDIYYNRLIAEAEQDRLRNNYAQSLPPSAWRTYTIYPKQLLDKGTSMPIWDTRYDKVADDQKAKSRVTVTLYIDSNGKVSQNIERTLVLSDSVW